MREAHLKDVDRGLVDGADNGTPRIDGVTYCAHHNGCRPRVQARCWLVLCTRLDKFTQLASTRTQFSYALNGEGAATGSGSSSGSKAVAAPVLMGLTRDVAWCSGHTVLE